jgi:hypothetical protein
MLIVTKMFYTSINAVRGWGIKMSKYIYYEGYLVSLQLTHVGIRTFFCNAGIG